MPNIKCPSCQTLLSLDPSAASAFECPSCGKQLRLKAPALAGSSATRSTVPLREPDDDPPPVRRKKKKRRLGPSGEISPLMMPLGGVAILGSVALQLFQVSKAAEQAKADGGPAAVAYVITIVMSLIGLVIGAWVIQFSVNSMARRRRVPTVEFVEAVCLYPLVSVTGAIGACVIGFSAAGMFSLGPGAEPAEHDRIVIYKALFGLVGGIIGFVVAATPTIKLLLNTSWPDAGSIAARFLVVSMVLVVLLWLVLGILIAAVMIPRH